ncbi:Cyclomaltodextrin glucanotransferase [Luteimonas sp. 9C]|uniref:alpha-amylase family glycosyl hydrolase n=1 Tax=Luteimonas sp. 9C TaxID=2653148 RepID=UPI0012F33ABF|nr:alpha-amylase family glycosyl hydrolase [Luteimonas sp. 9C]VXB45947.1 Cyclomaltodextrin glucanotransferase [Luteimonas sp. 9C]
MTRALTVAVAALLCAGCSSAGAVRAGQAADGDGLYGTREPFAAHAVYFVVTDRFVNGDTSNDQRDQGGAHRTFDIPVRCPDGIDGNIGYLGGDFRGVLDNAGYIRDMGFGAVWITPIVANPDEAFTGGDPVACGSSLTDRGKTGYHGYWGTNFYKVDEHLPSADLDFRGFTDGMRAAGLKTVLDIVGNHGAPSWTMPEPQPGFGQIFDADGKLIADHQNLPPQQLDPKGNPLHAFYNATGVVDAKDGSIFDGNLAQLSDFDAANPAVFEYLAGAYEQWIGQGADAFRIDTIAWMPHAFWKRFADRIRGQHPSFFMFGEAFDYNADKIAEHTWARNGGVSVLDFPMKQAMDAVFAGDAGFERLAPALHLERGPYANPYDLATFYDNHDMPRMAASDTGFIDAHHWLFTARGIPVVYYGSETGFMRGRGEHAGNRGYYGQARVDAGAQSPIHAALTRIATLRRDTPALQRGLQLVLDLEGDHAAFYRVLDDGDTQQTALVLLNKGDAPWRATLDAAQIADGDWRDAFGGVPVAVEEGVSLDVPGHGVRVLLRDDVAVSAALRERLQGLMAGRLGGPGAK